MAARKNKGTKDAPWDEKVRERLRGSMLINRVEDHALGKVEMTASQLKAALGLIDKILPSLSSVQMDAKVDSTARVINAEPMSETDWDREYGNSLASSEGPAKSTH